MEEIYLPNSTVYTLKIGGDIVGFIALVDNYIAALFVKRSYMGISCGSSLIDYVKTKFKTLVLKVYIKNVSAIKFYKKHGFVELSTSINEDTNEIEFEMQWNIY